MMIKLVSGQSLTFSDSDKVRISGEYEKELNEEACFRVKSLVLL
jgi:uncharacterized protein YdeI (BOF family)